MSNVTQLNERRRKRRGNGAREALVEIAVELPDTSHRDAERWTDWLLAELWTRGFKVAPLQPRDEYG